jgi:hypothetical protein
MMCGIAVAIDWGGAESAVRRLIAGMLHRGDVTGWLDLFETALSDAALSDGQREFSDFAVATKEELFYLRSLANSMDVKRIPDLRGRLRLEA